MIARLAFFVARVLHWGGRRLDRFGPYAFLDARQQELGGVAPVDFDAVLTAYVAGRGARDVFFVQVGAHEGAEGDPLAPCVRRFGLSGLLVEPQERAFAALQANYADQPQVRFERAAIAGSDGSATFYSVAPGFWERHRLPGSASEIASLDPDQIRYHVELFGGRALAAREIEYLRGETVPAVTFGTLLRRHGVKRLDLLQIDAEGFDFEILKMVDWTAPPPLVHFETVHLSIEDRQAAWDLLRRYGYQLFATNSYNTLAIHSANTGAAQPK